MPIYYIAGISGSGKSTLVNSLTENGYEAYDADNDLCSWHDKAGNVVNYPWDAAERTDGWHSTHAFLMSEHKVMRLSAKENHVFICGIAPNDLKLAEKYFVKVLFMYITEEEMIRRVTTRPNNNYGSDTDQLEQMRKWYSSTVDKYKKYGAVIVDAMKPVEDVYNEVLKNTTG